MSLSHCTAGWLLRARTRPEFIDGQAHEIHAGAGLRAHAKPRDSTILVALDSRSQPGDIDLIQDQHLWHLSRADLMQYAIDLLDLRIMHWTGSINDVQQQIGFGSFFERRLKRSTEAR